MANAIFYPFKCKVFAAYTPKPLHFKKVTDSKTAQT